jgi:hypothetical protein
VNHTEDRTELQKVPLNSMILCTPLPKSKLVSNAESCLLWILNNKYLLMINIRRSGKASLSFGNKKIEPADRVFAISLRF